MIDTTNEKMVYVQYQGLCGDIKEGLWWGQWIKGGEQFLYTCQRSSVYGSSMYRCLPKDAIIEIRELSFRDDTLEECAQVADALAAFYESKNHGDIEGECGQIAAEIRALSIRDTP